jgi:uncharacterized protein YqjF (DUF2071 family)
VPIATFLSLTPSDLETIKALTPFVGGVVSGVTALLTLLGIKRKVGAFFGRLADRRRLKDAIARRQNSVRKVNARVRSQWYSHAYRTLVVSGLMNDTGFHALTVQQAAAHLKTELPAWALGGWERLRLSEMGKHFEAYDCDPEPDFYAAAGYALDGASDPVPMTGGDVAFRNEPCCDDIQERRLTRSCKGI